MKQNVRTALSVAALVGLCSTSFGAYGEVTVSGSTWTGRVDGSTKYTGSSMAQAEVACMNAMSSGTIVIKNSGNANGQMRAKTNVIVDGAGTTTSGGGTTGMLYAQNSSNIGGWNFVYNATNWYGHFWRTCNGQNMNGTRGTSNLTYRIDNCSGGTGYNLYVGSPSDSGASGSRGSHNLETYGIAGTNTVGTVTSNDRSGGNGTLLNFSSNFSISANNATRACWGCGYAGFRTANTNGKTTVGSITSTSCGRGYFSVSGSRDATISTATINTTSSHGIWLQTTYNTRVNAGNVRSGNPCTVITAGSGNFIGAGCDGSGGGGGGGGGGTYYKLQNRATGLYVDGMGRTSNGSICGQWSGSSSHNQQWALVSTDGYYRIQNRATGLFIDGMGNSSNGSAVAQWANTSHVNAQWTQESAGSYYKYRNRATNLYLDGMGRTSNGSDLGQWSSSSSYNQQFSRPGA